MPEIIKNPLTNQELDRILHDDDSIEKTIEKLRKRKIEKDIEGLAPSVPSINLTNKELADLKAYLANKETLPDLHVSFGVLMNDLAAEDKTKIIKSLLLVVKILKQNLGL